MEKEQFFEIIDLLLEDFEQYEEGKDQFKLNLQQYVLKHVEKGKSV